MTTPDTESALSAIKKAFGDECVVVQDYQADRDLLKKYTWVLEDLGNVIHVIHKGATLGIVDQENLTFATDFGCSAEGLADLPQAIKEQAHEWAEQEMWPVWEKHGYVIDTGATNHEWDSLERLWLINVIKEIDSNEALVQELRWVAIQERIQFIR